MKLPGLGTVAGFGGDQDNTETFYIFTSYNTPTAIYRYDVPANKSELIRLPEGEVQPRRFRRRAGVLQEQGRHARADDAWPIARTMPIATKPQPTLLYGYGGYSISISPAFSADYIAWMELGGVVAVANLRGGGEYGEDWHLAGKNLKKQNVFDDFIAAAEWLIAEQPHHAATSSPSWAAATAGCLVGAVMVAAARAVRRPASRWSACWTCSASTSSRPGSSGATNTAPSTIRRSSRTCSAYSPYHNIKDGVQYPATLIMTADTDDRVVPMHSFKFAAALQRAQAGDAPILLRIETRAGHGARHAGLANGSKTPPTAGRFW